MTTGSSGLPGTVAKTVFILLLVCAGFALSYAHAVVVESHPRDGEVLSQPPAEITIRFNARIEKTLTKVSLSTGDGKSVRLPAQNKDFNEEQPPERLVILLPPLGPGTYLLRYQVLSTDGHATLGLLRFTVAGPH